jgi:hypothetical protein
VRRLALTSVLLCALPCFAAAGAAAKLTPAEQTWAAPVLKLDNSLAENLALVSEEERASGALIAGSGRNNTLLSATLGVFASCASELAAAGSPPGSRLESFDADMRGSCADLRAGALELAHAIGEVGKGDGPLASASLETAGARLAAGSHLLGLAERQIATVGRSGLRAA